MAAFRSIKKNKHCRIDSLIQNYAFKIDFFVQLVVLVYREITSDRIEILKNRKIFFHCILNDTFFVKLKS